MGLRALGQKRLVVAALQCWAVLTEAAFHTSSTLGKKKRPFYNKYYAQLKNRHRIYTGFAYEVLQKQDEKTRIHSEDDYDFEEELLSESRRRRGAYEHSKRLRSITKGPGPRLLTWEQMEHIRFLNQTEPDEWTVEMLSHSFQVPEQVIRKVLKSKRVLGPLTREKLDAKAHKNLGIAKLPTAIITKNAQDGSLIHSDPTAQIPNQSWGLPDWKNVGWFSGYDEERTMPGGKTLTEESNVNEVSWLEEDESEFYSYVYRAEESWWDGEDSPDTVDLSNGSDHHLTPDETNVTTNDGKNFHDREGNFLYRI